MTTKEEKAYRSFEKAFANVHCYALVNKGKHIGHVSIKYPRDGAGRLHAYVHVYSLAMTHGYAGGYGYDKATAAVVKACKEIKPKLAEWYEEENKHADELHKLEDNGHDWIFQLSKLGYELYRGC